MDYRNSQVIGRGEIRQFFDILVKNLDNFLHLLHTIDLWYPDGSLDQS